MSSYDQQMSTSIDFGNGTIGDGLPEPSRFLLGVVNTIIACLAVLANSMVIAVMLVRRRVFSSFTNRLILHQSVIDLIAGVVFFFHQVVKDLNIPVSMDGNTFDQFVCRFVASDFLLWCAFTTSTYNLVLISLERLMATCYPVKHRQAWSAAKLKLAVVTSWGIGCAYATHALFVYEAHQGHCRLMEKEFSLRVILTVLGVGTEYLAPIGIMIYAYTKIFIMLTNKVKNPLSSHQKTLGKAKRNVLITTGLIGIVFLLCWTPSEVLFIYLLCTNSSGGLLYRVFTGLAACNMFINPIIYCFKYEHFRSQLKDLVLERLQRNRVNNV